MNTCDKFYWIKDHPAFINKALLPVELEIDPHMVCPITNRIEDYKPLNTQHQLWVEVLIPQFNSDEQKWEHAHDWNLDTGGNTWEEMIEKLYLLVLEHYGDYTDEDVDKKNAEVYGYKISRQTITGKPRKLKVRWNITGGWVNKWSDDILDDSTRSTYFLEMDEVKGTINALTEYRKTCNISEYDAVDAELEKNQYILFEQQISLQTGIDLVRK